MMECGWRVDGVPGPNVEIERRGYHPIGAAKIRWQANRLDQI